MGADGGSIPDRRDLVKTKAKAEQTDRALQRQLFFLCALSKKALVKPVVADPLGKLYNKDAILEYLLDKSTFGDGDQICGYVKSVKDLISLSPTLNPASTEASSGTSSLRAPFVCPLSLKEMTGAIPFVALRSCGCVFSETAVRAVVPSLTRGILPRSHSNIGDDPKAISPASAPALPSEPVACPNCGIPFEPSLITSVIPINPSRDIQDALLESLLTARAAAKSSKKRKVIIASAEDSDMPRKVSRGSGGNGVTPSTVARSVQDKLAEQEKKRLAAQSGMSDAVKSMFRPKEAPGTKNATAEFFGRTFNRYAA